MQILESDSHDANVLTDDGSMHPLDNPIWTALTTRQSGFATGAGVARSFQNEVTSLSGFERPDDAGYAALAETLGGRATGVFLDSPYEARDGWEFIAGAPLIQMVASHDESAPAVKVAADIVELALPDSAAMIELTALTKPGPFGKRTHELGGYVGIRDGERLVAMAGERLKVEGFTEVSAVCTHPDYLGRGYAGALMQHVMRGVRARGDTPFLHSRADNARAIAVYERLGFCVRQRGHFAVVRWTGRAGRGS